MQTRREEPAGTACSGSDHHSGQSGCLARCSSPSPSSMHGFRTLRATVHSPTQSMHFFTLGRHCTGAESLTPDKRPFLCSSVHDRRLQAQHQPCHGLFPQRQALLSLPRTVCSLWSSTLLPESKGLWGTLLNLVPSGCQVHSRHLI